MQKAKYSAEVLADIFVLRERLNKSVEEALSEIALKHRLEMSYSQLSNLHYRLRRYMKRPPSPRRVSPQVASALAFLRGEAKPEPKAIRTEEGPSDKREPDHYDKLTNAFQVFQTALGDFLDRELEERLKSERAELSRLRKENEALGRVVDAAKIPNWLKKLRENPKFRLE